MQNNISLFLHGTIDNMINLASFLSFLLSIKHSPYSQIIAGQLDFHLNK